MFLGPVRGVRSKGKRCEEGERSEEVRERRNESALNLDNKPHSIQGRGRLKRGGKRGRGGMVGTIRQGFRTS